MQALSLGLITIIKELSLMCLYLPEDTTGHANHIRVRDLSEEGITQDSLLEIEH